jgi:hypothetical protein
MPVFYVAKKVDNTQLKCTDTPHLLELPATEDKDILTTPIIIAMPSSESDSVIFGGGITPDNDDASITCGALIVGSVPYFYDGNRGHFYRQRGSNYDFKQSANNTAATITIPTYNMKSLDIVMVTSAGTASVTVEISTNGSSYVTAETIAAAASTAKHYDDQHLAATLAINPMNYPWVKLTIGTAGVGNSTTTRWATK